ncbi:MAG: transposase [Flavobacteriaceae bacterium]|nr:transposase [Candidatus Onthonaster equi]
MKEIKKDLKIKIYFNKPMKPLLLIFCLTNFAFAQTELETLELENSNLKAELKQFKTENVFLRNVFDLNQPEYEITQENISYKITSIKGNKEQSKIKISLLIESIDENKRLAMTDFECIDLEGIIYKINLNNSDDVYPKLTKNVPIKFNFTIDTLGNQPIFMKLLKIRNSIQPESNLFLEKRGNIYFRDLRVSW